MPELFKYNKNAKVIVISGHSKSGEAMEMLNSGALSFIQKPYTLPVLTNKIHKALKSTGTKNNLSSPAKTTQISSKAQKWSRGIRHEINNFLGAITGAIDLAIEHNDPLKYTQDIISSHGMLNTITQGLRSFDNVGTADEFYNVLHTCSPGNDKRTLLYRLLLDKESRSLVYSGIIGSKHEKNTKKLMYYLAGKIQKPNIDAEIKIAKKLNENNLKRLKHISKLIANEYEKAHVKFQDSLKNYINTLDKKYLVDLFQICIDLRAFNGALGGRKGCRYIIESLLKTARKNDDKVKIAIYEKAIQKREHYFDLVEKSTQKLENSLKSKEKSENK